MRNADPPAYRRRRRPNAVDPYESQIRELLHACNTMPATVIAERIGWERGMTNLKERVAELRPLFLEADPYQRTDYPPGELAQWDLWFPSTDIPLGYGNTGRLPVIVGVSGRLGRWAGSRAPLNLVKLLAYELGVESEEETLKARNRALRGEDAIAAG